MSKIQDAKGFPGNQPFNVGARKCQSKKKAWFQVPPFHNNRTSKKKED